MTGLDSPPILTPLIYNLRIHIHISVPQNCYKISGYIYKRRFNNILIIFNIVVRFCIITLYCNNQRQYHRGHSRLVVIRVKKQTLNVIKIMVR